MTTDSTYAMYGNDDAQLSAECISAPTLCIVSPSRNQGQYIGDMLVSLRRQRYECLTHLIYDAHSTDNTAEVVATLKPPFTRFIVENDRGPANAINKALDQIDAELFNWLNTDDYLFDGTLRALGVIAEKWPEFDIYAFKGCVSSDCGLIGSHGSFWKDVRFAIATGQIGFAQESTFIRTRFIKENGIHLDESVRNVFDSLFYRDLLSCGARVLFINACGGVIRFHEGTLTVSGAPDSDWDALRKHDWHRRSWRRRMYQRLCASRAGSFLRCLHRIRIFDFVLRGIFVLARNPYGVVQMVGISGRTRDDWVVVENG